MKHLEDMTDCSRDKIACKFSSHGCTVNVMASEMERHLNDAIHDHLALLCDELTSVKEQAKQLEQQLMEERQARMILENKMSELSVKLNKMLLPS